MMHGQQNIKSTLCWTKITKLQNIQSKHNYIY